MIAKFCSLTYIITLKTNGVEDLYVCKVEKINLLTIYYYFLVTADFFRSWKEKLVVENTVK